MAKAASFVVVGGCNLDIYATSAKELICCDSNPGTVSTSPGGVGRNIAENLARLGHCTSMLTALGSDAFAIDILQKAEEVKLDLSRSLRLPHLSTSVYVCLNNPDGDIALAVSAMDICDQIDAGYMADNQAFLDQAKLIVADANLPVETICFLTEYYANKLCFDCVSTIKAPKVLQSLAGLFCLKANMPEAATLTGLPVTNSDEAATAAKVLHQKGVSIVIITLGQDGAFISDGKQAYCMPLMNGDTVNTSGCGDAFFAGAVASIANGEELPQTLRTGLAMARLCAASSCAVSPEVSQTTLNQTLNHFRGGKWK
ncbi:MAG: MarR family transcriptional regulator [Clostridiales bacterium]|nr:MarR family transcriptional regulator [Clostridiales bacterium]